MTRRSFLAASAAAASASAIANPPRTKLGIARDSLPVHHFTDTIAMLDYCAALGAAGVQTPLSSLDPAYLKRLRTRADELGMYLEVQSGLVRQDPEKFERIAAAAKEIGASCIRAACLGGRRYETFHSLSDWKTFVASSRGAIERSAPVVERYKIPLAIENHKDWTVDEMVPLIKSYSSEYIGVCLDTGNNISLLDDPMQVVYELAPYAAATHLKDMGVNEYPEGFLLSEVPLGEGFLDIKTITQVISKARPKTHFSLEMITRDPLKVPCLTPGYWTTFPDRSGRYVAETMTRVREHRRDLPVVSRIPHARQVLIEDENIKQSLHWYREHIG